MKKSEVENAAKQCLEQHKDYFDGYIHSCCKARESTGWNWANPDYSDPVKVVEWFNAFWMALPDNKAIRHGGFWDMCNIAECIFGFDDEDTLEVDHNAT